MLIVFHFPLFQISYAKVTHDQHALENIAVFNFHEHDHDHDHDHDKKELRRHHGNNRHGNGQEGQKTDNLPLILTVVIVVMSIVLGNFLVD